MDKFKKVKVIGNVIGFNMYTFGKKETYNVQFPDMTVAELESYQFEDADAYHTNGKPLCLRNVLARLRELPEHDRKVWLNGIMSEFEQDFSHAKWREGYEQGKFEYEVEKETRYRISMPKARNYKNHAQILCEKDGKMFWCAEWYSHKTKFTRKELEDAGFGWVFDCPGIEIEEVE